MVIVTILIERLVVVVVTAIVVVFALGGSRDTLLAMTGATRLFLKGAYPIGKMTARRRIIKSDLEILKGTIFLKSLKRAIRYLQFVMTALKERWHSKLSKIAFKPHSIVTNGPCHSDTSCSWKPTTSFTVTAALTVWSRGSQRVEWA
jgi:hypothetical protein